MAVVTPTIPAVSVEYIFVPVTSSVVLDTQTVEFAFLTSAPDADTSWIAATWVGEAAKTRSARVLIGPGSAVPLAPGTYQVWVRVHDTPEVPVRLAGSLKIE